MPTFDGEQGRLRGVEFGPLQGGGQVHLGQVSSNVRRLAALDVIRKWIQELTGFLVKS